MKSAVVVTSVALALVAVAGSANAKGCLKGAAVGAVAGHVAGHHAIVGAVAGCAIGHHIANKPVPPAPRQQVPAAPPSPPVANA